MKRTALILALVALGAVWAAGQDIKIQDNKPFPFAYLEGSGPYAGIGTKIGNLMQELTKQQVVGEGTPFAMYLNSPQDVKSPADLRWFVGIAVGKDAKVAAPLKRGDFAYEKVARCMYKGPYEAVGPTYGKVLAYIAANGYRPVGPFTEFYWNDPTTTAPADLLTEILVPVTKK